MTQCFLTYSRNPEVVGDLSSFYDKYVVVPEENASNILYSYVKIGCGFLKIIQYLHLMYTSEFEVKDTTEFEGQLHIFNLILTQMDD